MASFGPPRTLPGDDGRRTVTHENVDNHVRGRARRRADNADAPDPSSLVPQDGAGVDDVDGQLSRARDPS
jgi:hypothetical protein